MSNLKVIPEEPITPQSNTAKIMNEEGEETLKKTEFIR